MRRLIIVAAAISAATSAAPSEAAENGSITGRVINAISGRAQAGVEITLVGANEDGSERIRRTTTTRRGGRYEFDGLATGSSRFYVLDARYDDGLFAGRALTLPSDTKVAPVINTTMRVWETTTNPASILIRRDNIFLVANDNGLGVIESVVITNTSERAYIGRGGDRPGAPTIGFSLPATARGESITVLDSTIDIPEIVRTDFGFGATVAIPPDETRVTFAYRVPGDVGSFDVSRTALYPTAELSVFAADPLDVESNRLEPAGSKTLAGRRYQRFSAPDGLNAGDPLQVRATTSSNLNPLIPIGVAGGLLLLAGAAIAAVRRRPPKAVLPRARDDVLEEIAALDIRYRAGEINEQEWSNRRADLKSSLQTPEPAP